MEAAVPTMGPHSRTHMAWTRTMRRMQQGTLSSSSTLRTPRPRTIPRPPQGHRPMAIPCSGAAGRRRRFSLILCTMWRLRQVRPRSTTCDLLTLLSVSLMVGMSDITPPVYTTDGARVTMELGVADSKLGALLGRGGHIIKVSFTVFKFMACF